MAEQVIGAKVRIEVNEEGSYEGYVHNINEITKKLTLAKVTSCMTGTRLHGLHHFFPNEITNLTVIEQKQEAGKNNTVSKLKKNTDTAEHSENVAAAANEGMNKPKPVSQRRDLPVGYQRNFSKKHLEKDKSNRDPSDEGSRLLQRKHGHQNCYSDDFVETTEDLENFTINPPDVVLIDSFGETFEQAIAYICRQRVIGVAWEGLKVGRFGQLCLMQIGCNKCIYIFDIITLGGRAFDCGLADIMDSADILKVIHNCRHFSDALYHQHGISLVNVFDTQVADAIIYRNEVHDRKFPRQTSSLISCLYEYLDLSPDQYHFHKIRLKHLKKDEMVWKNRPIPKDLIDVAAKTVMYLRELRLAQMERMMEEFIHGVDIYLTCMRDASDEVVKKKYSSTSLPEMFHEIPKRRERPRYRQLDPELDTNDNEEKRQVWEDGHSFMEKYEQSGMRIREHKYAPFAGKLDHTSPFPTPDNIAKDEGLSNAPATGITKLGMYEQAPLSQQDNRNPRTIDARPRKFSSGRGSSTFGPGNSGIFREDDFPHLSSDSDSGGHSPASVSVQHTRPSRDSRFGRGRAASLLRNAQLPNARRPTERPSGLPSYIGAGQHDRLQFPPDEELLASSEIVSASGLKSIPSGPRVRISRQ